MCDPLGVCARRHNLSVTSTWKEQVLVTSIPETEYEGRNTTSAFESSAENASRIEDGTDDASQCKDIRGSEDNLADPLDENSNERHTYLHHTAELKEGFPRRPTFALSPAELKRSRSCSGLIERSLFHLEIANLPSKSPSKKPSNSSVSTAFFSAQSRRLSLDGNCGNEVKQLGKKTIAEDDQAESSRLMIGRQLLESSANEPQQYQEGIVPEGTAPEIDTDSGDLVVSSVRLSLAQSSPTRSLKRAHSTLHEEEEFFAASRGKKQRISRLIVTESAQRNAENYRSITVDLHPARSSTFRNSDWNSVDQSVFNYASANAVFVKSKDTAASSLTRLIQPSPDHEHAQDNKSSELRSEPIQDSTAASESAAMIRSIETLDAYNNISMDNAGNFVSAISKFNEINPGCDAIQRFKDMPTRCLANKLDGSRCRSNISSGPSPDIESLLLDLLKLNFSENIPRGINALAKLTHFAICRYQRHHVWRSLYSLLPINEGSSPTVPRSTLSNTTAETHNGYLRLRSSLIGEDVATNIPDTTAMDWLKDLRAQVPQHLPVYLSYHSLESKPRNINDLLREEATKPLDTSCGSGRFSGLDERRSGYIYVYWNRASFGLMKIGCTTRDVGVRIQEWEEQCHHIADEQYRSRQPVNNIAKVEKLLHLEFRQHRVLEPICHGCGRSHIEWFQGLDLRHVIARIEAWTQWISQEPYESWGDYNLKPAMHGNIPLLGIGMDAENDTPRSAPASPRRSARYDLRRRSTARRINIM